MQVDRDDMAAVPLVSEGGDRREQERGQPSE
jgi:hypothetical protein